jgi:hypothetical protein
LEHEEERKKGEIDMKRAVLEILASLMAVFIFIAPVYADTSAPAVIDASTSVPLGLGTAASKNTFYGQGRHWEVYINNVTTSIVYRSSSDGITWASPVSIDTGTNLLGPEFSIWFDNSTQKLHYARHQRTDNTTVYRMGTPGSNGVITWAADEQDISDAKSGSLLTFRVNICTDINGYPWVGWIDSGTNPSDQSRGVIYISSSSTKNGTWTSDVNATIDTDGNHAWFLQLTPISSFPYPKVEVGYSLEHNVTHAGTLMAADSNDTFVSRNAVAASGTMNITRPDAFSFHAQGSSMRAVYTDNLGSVMYRTRSSAQTWNVAAAAADILSPNATGGIWIPTISSYNFTSVGDDYICIANNNDLIKYTIDPAGVDGWSAWTTVWNAPANSAISRHSANYDGDVGRGLPLGLTWQLQRVPATVGTDAIYYWWITDNGVGYFPDAPTPAAPGGTSSPIILAIPLIMALIVIVIAFRIMQAEGMDIRSKLIAIGTVAFLGVILVSVLTSIINSL